ncbi:MAG: hypothetical protein D6B28_06020 [Gammaproteobacteria bacterium]|nr:MAG: hypothetical protein D6B28_06020 [Gammaproteobacteria bacterium]
MDTLPGGYWDGSNCQKRFNFRELTGQLELDLADAVTGMGRNPNSAPVLVTSVLSKALDNIDGKPATKEIVHDLSVPDRQYLMRKLAILLGYDTAWFSKDCSSCAERFDFQITYSDLPVFPAKEGYPYVIVNTKHGKQKFRVPTGADQEAILKVGNDIDSETALLRLCYVPEKQGHVSEELGYVPEKFGRASEKARHVSHVSDDELEFSEKDTAKIGAALEEVSPSVITNINAGCPECGESHQIRLDPYFLLEKNIGSQLLNDIHTIAQSYHWNEKEILALSKQRREIYLDLIEQDSIARE